MDVDTEPGASARHRHRRPRRLHRPGPRRRLALAALLLSGLACAPPRLIRFADRPPTLDGDVPLAYSGSGVTTFVDRRGRRCPPSSGRAEHAVIGWQSPDDDPLCTFDTLVQGPGVAVLELRWQAAVPASGEVDLLARRQAVGAWGRVEARGTYFGQYLAAAEVELEASAPSCSGSARLLLGKGEVTGPWNRSAAFAGFLELPDIEMHGCVEGERLELRLRLVAHSNRGRVEVDGFGAAAGTDADVAKAFLLRPRVAPIPTPAQPSERGPGGAADLPGRGAGSAEPRGPPPPQP